MSYIFSSEIGIISANLSNDNLDDVNFNEDDSDTIIQAILKNFTKKINEIYMFHSLFYSSFNNK